MLISNSFSVSLVRQQAFTLLEVLIAMGISAVIYVGAYSLLDSVLKTDEVVSEKRLALENTQRALQIMQRDIEQIIPRPIRSSLGEYKNTIEFDSIEQKLSFTRTGWRNPVGRMRSNMQRVAYYTQDNQFYREHWLALDNVAGVESKENVLLKDVEALSFRFYEASSKQWRSDWNKELGEKESIPLAIELNLKTKQFGELTRVFMLVENRESVRESP